MIAASASAVSTKWPQTSSSHGDEFWKVVVLDEYSPGLESGGADVV
jgi:hypothetical protein